MTNPTLTLYPSEEDSQTWVLVAPGGGYGVVAIYVAAEHSTMRYNLSGDLQLSMEQEGEGLNKLPQGQVDVRQVTRLEIHGAG